MRLTKKMLQEAGVTPIEIELIGENEDGSVNLDSEAILRLHNSHFELDIISRFIPWESVPEFKAAITKSREQLWEWKSKQDREFFRRTDNNRELLAACMCLILDNDELSDEK